MIDKRGSITSSSLLTAFVVLVVQNTERKGVFSIGKKRYSTDIRFVIECFLASNQSLIKKTIFH